ncbi:MAG TPA: non-homologous end-joining DNA ligase [Mycobacteriales bacterium]|nr:non-homologous end-joining DNA ligase [Mycobacteriales bacterium]
MSPERVTVTVEDRTLTLSNLDKVLYPATGFTKGEVIDYYTRIAPVMLPYIESRPLTLKRYPDGVDGKSFFEKNAPSHTPDWIPKVRLPTPGSTKDRDTIDFVVAHELPTVVWAANLAALELHVPMWRVGPRGKVFNPDVLVFDLDPGAPASIVECCEVALLLRERLQADGLSAYPKTSGSKGMQLYVPLDAKSPWEDVHGYAKLLARDLTESHKDLVVWQMKKDLRGGKVLVDWSQNNSAKTTVAVYSLRAREAPTVSTPISWEEVEGCDRPEQLRFTAPEVLDRVTHLGDLFTAVLDGSGSIPAGAGE